MTMRPSDVASQSRQDHTWYEEKIARLIQRDASPERIAHWRMKAEARKKVIVRRAWIEQVARAAAKSGYLHSVAPGQTTTRCRKCGLSRKQSAFCPGPEVGWVRLVQLEGRSEVFMLGAKKES